MSIKPISNTGSHNYISKKRTFDNLNDENLAPNKNQINKYKKQKTKEEFHIDFFSHLKKQATNTSISSSTNMSSEPFSKFDKIVIVEIYSEFDETNLQSNEVTNEIIGNFESGTNISKKYHPKDRYIWSCNEDLSKLIDDYAIKHNYLHRATNLWVDNKDLKLGKDSKLIIVGQGNLEEHKIGSFVVDDFIERFLQEDLEISHLSELELHVCKLGQDKEYINKIDEYFNNQTNIITYSTLVTTKQSGETIAFDDDGIVINLSESKASNAVAADTREGPVDLCSQEQLLC